MKVEKVKQVKNLCFKLNYMSIITYLFKLFT